jgi:hypothetical protein
MGPLDPIGPESDRDRNRRFMLAGIEWKEPQTEVETASAIQAELLAHRQESGQEAKWPK